MVLSCEFVRRGLCIPFLLVYVTSFFLGYPDSCHRLLLRNTLTLNYLVPSFLLGDQYRSSLDASAGCILWHISCPMLNFSSRYLFLFVSMNQVTVTLRPILNGEYHNHPGLLHQNFRGWWLDCYSPIEAFPGKNVHTTSMWTAVYVATTVKYKTTNRHSLNSL